MARQRHVETTHENHERWLLTYADMITLLVAFFVMMWGVSRVEQEKLDRLQSGVQASLGIASGGRAPIGQDRPGARPDVVKSGLSPAQKIHARMEEFVGGRSSSPR